jgi:hypothetical protein
MWLLMNLREAEPVILIGSWVFLFVVVPAVCVLAGKLRGSK